MSKITAIATGLSFLSLIYPLSAEAIQFNQIYVFSDSSADSGNVFNVSSAAHSLGFPVPITPTPPYFEGRFSNGYNWIDILTSQLGVDLIPSTELTVGEPIIPSTPPEVNFNFGGATATNSVNFAFGGAQTGLGNVSPELGVGVLTEINGFINDLNVAQTSANPDALYIVWAGNNDYNKGGLRDSAEPINNLFTGVTALAEAGARHFFIPNLPDLGKTPRGIIQGEEAELTQVSAEHNAGLTTMFDDLRLAYDDINIISADLASLFQEVITQPDEFGFTNVTDFCFTELGVCSNPDEYLFWDDIHPTAKTHALWGNYAYEALQDAGVEPLSVPEPAFSIPLLLMGVGFLLQSTVRHRNSL
ncbi:SGNH/GDSL hydrolase family protein [Coleofasciculus sp.]|uniref:SGNH/GDSL hydrolase family protein n=1 Tax=Coleofasciculus sp. TaxID=3100458 RepID=UPI0039F85843